MSFKPEISTDGGKSFGQNAQVFATREEAEAMARDIFGRWMLATDYRVVESDEPVNYEIKGGALKSVPQPVPVDSEGGEV